MEQGKKATQGIIEEIMGNDALRLDSAARNAFIAKKRAEMYGSVGEGNDFYLNGFTKSIDAELNQYEIGGTRYCQLSPRSPSTDL